MDNKNLLEDISIRTELRPGDIGYVIHMHGRLYGTEYNYGVQFESYVSKGLCEFYKQYDPKRNRVWICEHNDKMIGFLLLMDRGDAAQLRYFLIEPEYRGIGLGSKLLTTRHQWTVVEYAQLADVEAFFDRRCELIEGEIIDMPPASARHALAIEVLRDFFARSLPMGMCCGSQTPVVLGHDSEPEPDLWVANVARRALGGQKPQAGHLTLVVEVADSSYQFDRSTKLPLYARHGIATMWLVDARRSRVEVYTGPDEDGYSSHATFERGATVALPWGGEFTVDEMFSPS